MRKRPLRSRKADRRRVDPLPARLQALGIPADYGAQRGLQRQREATRLVVAAKGMDGTAIRLTPRAAMAWRRMQAAAERDGVALWALSGFRSVRRQTEIVRRKLARGDSIAEVLRVIAAQGYSEHHTGRAVDIGSPENASLEESFELTAAYRWLSRHAGKFGFTLSYPRRNPHQIAYEPWHWCWRCR